MRLTRSLGLAAAAFLAAAPVFAQDPSPVGLWKNIDDESGTVERETQIGGDRRLVLDDQCSH